MDCNTIIKHNMCFIQIPDDIYKVIEQNTDNDCLCCSKYYHYDIMCKRVGSLPPFHIQIDLIIKSKGSILVFSFLFKPEMLPQLENNAFLLVPQNINIPDDLFDHFHGLGIPLVEKLTPKLKPILIELENMVQK